MRIAWVVPGGVDRTGVERVIPMMLDLMRRLSVDHELHVFALRQEPEPDSWPLLGCTVHNLGGAEPTLWRSRFESLATTHGPYDVVHGMWLGDCADLSLRLQRRDGTPALLSVLGGELVWVPEAGYGGARSWRARRQYRRQLRSAARVTSASRYLDDLIRPYGPTPVRWAPGVDTAEFRPVAAVAGPPWRLVHVASLNGVKGPFVMLDAMRRIVDAEPSARLRWIGIDTLGGAVQQRAASLGLSEAVEFEGWQPSEVVRAAFQASQLHLMASYHEAGQVVALEAAACGLPTVGTAVGYQPELHPDRGVAVPVGDAAALARETVALLRDPDRRAAMGRAARAWAVEHDADRSAASLLGLYRDLAERRR